MTSFLYSVIAAEGTDLLADEFFHLRLSIFKKKDGPSGDIFQIVRF